MLVDPAPLDADLRPARPRRRGHHRLRLVHDDGSLGDAVHRCTGVGKCVAPATTGVMCPSYLATREEKDSTRGRARVLQEALDGTLVAGLADPAVHEALDLCLSCKGCASDCPTGVDMAAYKAEALHQTYARSADGRAATTRWAGCRRWVRLAAPVAPAANRMLRLGPLARLAKATAGIDRRRVAARARSPDTAAQVRGGSPDERAGRLDLGRLVHRPLRPATAHAAIRLLEAAGLTVRVIDERACCGLTWVTTGQLDAARADRRAHGRHPGAVRRGRDAGPRPRAVVPGGAPLRRRRAHRRPPGRAVADGVLTLAELLTASPAAADLGGVEVVAQPHCHHASVLGFDADERLLDGAGAPVTRVAGCCGLAGNFGMERGHYETSVAVAETHLLPAVRSAPTRWCSPTGCPAGSSSPTWRGCPRCTSPSCSLARLDA